MGELAKKLDFGVDAMSEAERWAALRALPVRTEAFTPEEEAAFEEAERFMAAGEQGKSTDEIVAGVLGGA